MNEQPTKEFDGNEYTRKQVNDVIYILRENNHSELAQEFMIYRSIYGDNKAIDWICSILRISAMQEINEENNDEK